MMTSTQTRAALGLLLVALAVPVVAADQAHAQGPRSTKIKIVRMGDV